MTSPEPFNILLNGFVEVNGAPLILILPEEWKPPEHRPNSLIRPKLRLVTLVCHGPIPAELQNKLLTVFVDEISVNCVLIGSDSSVRMAPLLGTAWLSATTHDGDNRLRLSESSVDLLPNQSIRRLTLRLATEATTVSEATSATKLRVTCHLLLR